MIITIHDSKASAAIDSLGAQLISYQDAAGKEYIWQRDPKYWANCSPLLFPAVGASRNGRTLFDGEWYEMPQHGFCKISDFDVTSQSDAEVTFRLTANEVTRKHYPYEFILELTYRLEDGALHMDYRVTNPQLDDLHYCLGAHPGFICPMEEGAAFDDYQLVLSEKEHTKSMVFDEANKQYDVNQSLVTLEDENVIPLTYELFDKDAVFFESLRSRSVSILHKDTKKGIQVDFPGFETVAFWTPSKKYAPFVCVEPWNGSAIRSDEDDEFIHKHHLQTLQCHESRLHQLVIRIVE